MEIFIKKIGLKKFIIFSLIFFSLIVVSFFFLLNLQNKALVTEATEQFKKINDHNAESVDISILFSQLHVQASLTIREKDPEKLEKTIHAFNDIFKNLEKLLQQCTSSFCIKSQPILKSYKTEFDTMTNKYTLYGKSSESTDYYLKMLAPIYDAYIELLSFSNTESKKSSELQLSKQLLQVATQSKRQLFLSLFFVVCTIIAGLVAVYFLINFFKKINHNIQSTHLNLTTVAQNIVHSSEEIKTSNHCQNEAINEINSISHTFNFELNKSLMELKKLSEDADNNIEYVKNANLAFNNVLDVFQKIKLENKKIMDQAIRNSTEFKKVTELIAEIDNKTKIINDIVFQTKLLSFNASVEAARAGEHGKGFAVVAEEIGKLALISGKASLEISELLHSSVGKVNDILKSGQDQFNKIINQSEQIIEHGNISAEECQSILRKTENDITNSSSQLKTVAEKTSLQIKDSNQIALKIEHISNLSIISSKSILKYDLLSKDLENESHRSEKMSMEIKEYLKAS